MSKAATWEAVLLKKIHAAFKLTSQSRKKGNMKHTNLSTVWCSCMTVWAEGGYYGKCVTLWKTTWLFQTLSKRLPCQRKQWSRAEFKGKDALIWSIKKFFVAAAEELLFSFLVFWTWSLNCWFGPHYIKIKYYWQTIHTHCLHTAIPSNTTRGKSSTHTLQGLHLVYQQAVLHLFNCCACTGKTGLHWVDEMAGYGPHQDR